MKNAIKIIDLVHIAVLALVLLLLTFAIGLADTPSGQRIIVEVFAMFAVWTWLFYVAVALNNSKRTQKILSAVLFVIGVLLFFSFMSSSGETIRPTVEVIDSFLLRAWIAIAAAVAFAFSHFAHDMWLRFQRNVAAVCFSIALLGFMGILAYDAITRPSTLAGVPPEVMQTIEVGQTIFLIVGVFISLYTLYRVFFVKD